MRVISRPFCALSLTVLCVACGGDGSKNTQRARVQPPEPPVVTVDAGLKQLIFGWANVAGATHYKLFENPDGHSGFTQTGDDIPAGTLSVTQHIAVHLHDFANALYMLQACNAAGCAGSAEVSVTDLGMDAVGYFKASNPERGLSRLLVDYPQGDGFGAAIAVSADGSTLAVGAPREDGGTTGVNGEQTDNSAWNAGAVYVFRLSGGKWSQQAYIKASNAGGGDRTLIDDDGDLFGSAISLSSDGNTLAVGARYEDSSATGINGEQDDDLAIRSGAAYIFRFDGTDWTQQAYIKASNAEGELPPTLGDYLGDYFGYSVALSGGGNTLAVGTPGEDSSATGINGDQADNSADAAGAAYVFRFDGADWSQQAYVKSSDTRPNGGFGRVSLSADGDTMAVEGYIFQFDGAEWYEQACVLILESGRCAHGRNELSADGTTLLLGSRIFWFDGTEWSEQVNIEYSDPDGSVFYENFALSGDGNMVAMGVQSTQDEWYETTGTVHIFRFNDNAWPKRGDPIIQDPANPEDNCDWYPYEIDKDYFGYPVSLNFDGSTMAVGATGEDSGSAGVGGDRNDNSECESGAVYLY